MKICDEFYLVEYNWNFSVAFVLSSNKVHGQWKEKKILKFNPKDIWGF